MPRKVYRRIPKRKVKKTGKHRRMFRGGRKGCGCSGGGFFDEPEYKSRGYFGKGYSAEKQAYKAAQQAKIDREFARPY